MTIATRYEYSARGLPTRTEEDDYSDGTTDMVWVNEFDSDDRWIHHVYYEDYPTWHGELWFTYDSSGRVSEVRSMDQITSGITTFTYQCDGLDRGSSFTGGAEWKSRGYQRYRDYGPLRRWGLQ
jgi:hypothetical protein